ATPCKPAWRGPGSARKKRRPAQVETVRGPTTPRDRGGTRPPRARRLRFPVPRSRTAGGSPWEVPNLNPIGQDSTLPQGSALVYIMATRRFWGREFPFHDTVVHSAGGDGTRPSLHHQAQLVG